MPKIRLRFDELNSHGRKSSLERLQMDDDANCLLPCLSLQKAQALALLKGFPHLQNPAFGVHRDGEALLFKRRLVADFSLNA